MRKKIFLMILIWLAVLSIPKRVLAQDSNRVVVLSPRVGAVIDSSERDHFHLFQQIKNFHSAMILENPDSTYFAWIVLKEANGNATDTAVWYSKSYLLMLAERINHFEELAEGRYQMGENPATLQGVGSEEATMVPLLAKPRAEARAQAVEVEGVLSGSRSEGAKVVLFLSDGQEVTGELLSVMDSALVISTVEGADGESLQTQSWSLLVVRNQEILYVVVKGESKVLKGMGIGFLAGATLGASIGLASGDDPKNQFFSFTAGEKAEMGGIAFGGIGWLVGTIAGIASSTRDKVVEPLENIGFSSLKPLARNQGTVPDSLRAR